MKRALKALITILCALALACSGTAVFAQSGADEAGGYTDAVSAFADAERSARAEKTETWELFLPSSSEQFLPLNDLKDVAFNDSYIAVSDYTENGTGVIYIFNRSTQSYAVYSESINTSYSSLCFYENYLFFILDDLSISYIDCTSLNNDEVVTATLLTNSLGTTVSANSLIINGNTLFCARKPQDSFSVNSYTITLQNGNFTASDESKNLTPNLPSPLPSNQPYFSIYNEQVFYSIGNAIYSVDTQSRLQCETSNTIASFAIIDSTCYYSVTDSHYLYTRSLDSTATTIDEPVTIDGSPISGVLKLRYNEQENLLYFVTSSSVKAFSPTANSYTGYEITQYSSSPNRLGENAADISLYGNHVVIADHSNSRILLYNNETTTFTSITLSSVTPSIVVAGKDSFLVSNGTSVYFYSYEGAEIFSYSFSNFEGSIIDCAYSYNAYYIITSTPRTYQIFETITDGSYSYSLSAPGTISNIVPSALTTDINGNLWVLSQNTAYEYTVENFLSNNGSRSDSISFGTTVLDILVDYEGTVYGLTEGSVLVGGATDARQLDLSSYVSYADGAKAVAFAFGFATDEAYILTDAGFLVQWSGGIASLDTIDENGAYSALTGALTDENGGADACGDLLVTISADAVLVSLDESALTAENYLPAAGYARAGEARVGVKVTDIADPDGGNTIGTLVALYEYLPGSGAQGSQHPYSLCLVLGEGAQPLALSEYYPDTADYAGYAGYTTNAVGLYNLPLMRQSGDAAYLAYRLELAKNTRVTVLGTVSLPAPTTGGYGLDADYCFVSYSADGQTVYGFVPASYLNTSPSSGITGSGSAEITYRHIAEGESVTLYDDAENARVFENEELLTVYGEADENGLVFVRYTADGISYSGWIEEALLAEASDFGIWVLVAVTIVTAAVLASACYLVLRKPPVMEAPLPAEEDADGDGSPESGTDLPDETDGNTPPQNGGQSGR